MLVSTCPEVRRRKPVFPDSISGEHFGERVNQPHVDCFGLAGECGDSGD